MPTCRHGTYYEHQAEDDCRDCWADQAVQSPIKPPTDTAKTHPFRFYVYNSYTAELTKTNDRKLAHDLSEKQFITVIDTLNDSEIAAGSECYIRELGKNIGDKS